MTTGTSDENNKSVIDSKMSNPAGRPGKDTDMAATVLFLAGPGGVFYNEQVLYPDGVSLLFPSKGLSLMLAGQYSHSALGTRIDRAKLLCMYSTIIDYGQMAEVCEIIVVHAILARL